MRSCQLCFKGMCNSVTNLPYDLSSSLLKYVENIVLGIPISQHNDGGTNHKGNLVFDTRWIDI